MVKAGSFLASVLLLFSRPVAAQQSPEAVTLKVTQDTTNFTLTVPISGLVMTIPKGGLQIQRGATEGAGNSPRYFYLADPSAPHLIISGWFESADGFTDIDSFWRKETAAWKRQGIAKPRDVAFEHIGTWNAVLYDMKGSDTANTNLRAHWIQSGTWIDIHLSMSGDDPPSALRQKLRDTLRSIRVTERAQ